jgi:hypothetical protein
MDGTPYPLPRHELPPAGTHWLERTVDLPPWTDTSRLALTIGSVNEVYEVYVNGKLIGASGEFNLWKTYVARPRTFPVPPGLATAGAQATIALKLWRTGFLSTRVRSLTFEPDRGPYLLTYRENAPPEVGAPSMSRRERAAAGAFVIFECAGVLAVILLLGWLMQRERKELGFLAGFLLSETIIRLYDYVALIADWPHMTNTLAGPALALGPLFLVHFAMATLGEYRRWLSIAAWAPFLFHFANNFFTLDGTGVPLWRDSFAATMWAIRALDLAIVWLAVRAWRASDYWYPLAIAATALLHGQRLPGPGQFPQLQFTTAGVRWTVYDFAILGLALAITLHLLRSLGAAKQRLATEIEAARMVQQLLLTSDAAAGSGYDIKTEYRPAQEVGGDFYQVLDRADGSRLVLVGDVSGKGLKAAMLVSVTVGALRRERSSSPGAVLAGLNDALAGHVAGGFVTCCCARLEPVGRVTIANAGHLAPYNDAREVAVEAGLPLGITADVVYPEATFQLEPGAQLTLVSDGVVEAENSQRELFGFERARELSTRPSAEIAAAAQAFGQNDDITVVTVRRIA